MVDARFASGTDNYFPGQSAANGRVLPDELTLRCRLPGKSIDHRRSPEERLASLCQRTRIGLKCRIPVWPVTATLDRWVTFPTQSCFAYGGPVCVGTGWYLS